MDDLLYILLTGMGATAVMDLWAVARQHLLGTALPNYGLVGRWLAHMRRGRFRHDSMAATSPVRGERVIGWVTHYLIGVAFAALLVALFGCAWMHRPTVVPALIIGLCTVAAPFLVMQPAMGAGIAASRTPRPAAARMQSIVTHMVFGLGLYAAAWAAHFVCTP